MALGNPYYVGTVTGCKLQILSANSNGVSAVFAATGTDTYDIGDIVDGEMPFPSGLPLVLTPSVTQAQAQQGWSAFQLKVWSVDRPDLPVAYSNNFYPYTEMSPEVYWSTDGTLPTALFSGGSPLYGLETPTTDTFPSSAQVTAYAMGYSETYLLLHGPGFDRATRVRLEKQVDESGQSYPAQFDWPILSQPQTDVLVVGWQAGGEQSVFSALSTATGGNISGLMTWVTYLPVVTVDGADVFYDFPLWQVPV